MGLGVASLLLAVLVLVAALNAALDLVAALLTDLKIIGPWVSLLLIVTLVVPILITSAAVDLAGCYYTMNLGGGLTCPPAGFVGPEGRGIRHCCGC